MTISTRAIRLVLDWLAQQPCENVQRTTARLFPGDDTHVPCPDPDHPDRRWDREFCRPCQARNMIEVYEASEV